MLGRFLTFKYLVATVEKNSFPHSSIGGSIFNDLWFPLSCTRTVLNQYHPTCIRNFFPTQFLLFISLNFLISSSCGNVNMGTTWILLCSWIIQVESLENSVMIPARLQSEIRASHCLSWITEMIQFWFVLWSA